LSFTCRLITYIMVRTLLPLIAQRDPPGPAPGGPSDAVNAPTRWRASYAILRALGV
jgi:hypothetical protein